MNAQGRTLALAAALLLQAAPAARDADGPADESLRQRAIACQALAEPAERLHCYDALRDVLQPPRFQGRLTETTPPFAVDRPTLLRYQSDGPIFVMALKAADGTIVQNLHIGGVGESSYLITRPGTYLLQIGGAETWRVWVEPPPAAR